MADPTNVYSQLKPDWIADSEGIDMIMTFGRL